MTEQSSAILTRFDVFVPGDYPRYSYVKRKFQHRRTGEIVDPEKQIIEALKQRGMIAQVVGPSKSGKTRAIENCIGTDNIVTIAGSQITSESSIWEAVARQLQTPNSTEFSTSSGTTWSGEAKINGSADLIFGSLEGEMSGGVEQSSELEKTTTIESDPFHSAMQSLRLQRKVLFLDDFHTIPLEFQSHVAAQLKAAAQQGVKICLAEVPHHSDSTISALPDLTGRVLKIEFQYWGQSDLEEIGRLGFEKLEVEMAPAALDAFSMEAAGSPQLMQMICLNAASFGNIESKKEVRSSLQFDLNAIRSILLRTHAVVDRERIFGILDQGPDERGNPRKRYPVRVLGEGDNYEIALAAISLSPPQTALSWNNSGDNILRRIDDVCVDLNNKPQKAQITRALEQMQALAEENMPRQPILEWSAVTGLQILDPYFLFHLRWSEKYEPLRAPPAISA